MYIHKMGNRISKRHLLSFIEDNTIGDDSPMTKDEDVSRSIAWLSYLCLYWVWEDDASNILSYLATYRGDISLNRKSVIDMIYAANLYRKQGGKPHMSDEEKVRFHIFTVFRKSRGTKRYPIYSLRNDVTGHIMEYICGRKFVKRYD